MFVPVLDDAHDHEGEDAQNNELPGDAQKYREPPVRLMQNEADDGHQENDWDEQPDAEEQIDFQPPAKPSIRREPMFGAEDEMPQAFGGTNDWV